MELNENINRIKNLMGISNRYEEDTLNEGLTDILYHHTNIDALKNILLSDKFYGSSTNFHGLEYKLSKKRYFYISTTRNRDQVSGEFRNRQVRIKLDGRKLSQRYKGAPVDYYGDRVKRPTKAPKSYYDPEFEDRIFFDLPYIENVSKYILGISIYWEYKYNFDINQNLIIINKLCKEKKIPLAIYENIKDFRYEKNPININDNFIEELKKFIKKSINVSDDYFKDLPKNEDKFEYSKKHFEIIALIALKNEKSIKEMFPKLTEDDISDVDKIIAYYTGNHHNHSLDYYYGNIGYYINKVAKEKNDESKDIINKMIKDMRKYGTREIKDYIKVKLEGDETK